LPQPAYFDASGVLGFLFCFTLFWPMCENSEGVIYYELWTVLQIDKSVSSRVFSCVLESEDNNYSSSEKPEILCLSRKTRQCDLQVNDITLQQVDIVN